MLFSVKADAFGSAAKQFKQHGSALRRFPKGAPTFSAICANSVATILLQSQPFLIFRVTGLLEFFTTDFMTMTKGYGIINHTFKEYRPLESVNIGERKLGVLVSTEAGKSSAYALGQLEDRGIMFIEPGVEVYEGMIVGLNSRGEDLAINVCKEKHLTNTRASGSDDALRLVPPLQMSLEKAIEFIAEDELVEVTPKNIRLRKVILDSKTREREARRGK